MSAAAIRPVGLTGMRIGTKQVWRADDLGASHGDCDSDAELDRSLVERVDANARATHVCVLLRKVQDPTWLMTLNHMLVEVLRPRCIILVLR